MGDEEDLALGEGVELETAGVILVDVVAGPVSRVDGVAKDVGVVVPEGAFVAGGTEQPIKIVGRRTAVAKMTVL